MILSYLVAVENKEKCKDYFIILRPVFNLKLNESVSGDREYFCRLGTTE
jgi:hypothetical protein